MYVIFVKYHLKERLEHLLYYAEVHGIMNHMLNDHV